MNASVAKIVARMGRFADFTPTMSSVGFLQCTLDVAVMALREWRSSIGWDFELVLRNDGMVGILRDFEPLSWPFDKEGLAAAHGWTAYVNNSALWGTEPAPIGELAMRAKCRAVEIALLPHTLGRESGENNGCGGRTAFVVHAPHRTEWINTERAVAVSYDDRWKFFQAGHRMEFERPDRYSAARIRDRLTPDDVIEYCNALGIRPYDAGFYMNDAVMFSLRGRAATRSENYAQARQRLGIVL